MPSVTSAAVQRFSPFGPPLVLEGEDAAAYEELLARVRAAVKPVDIIDAMFVDDVVRLQWKVLLWGRLKLGLIKASLSRPLEGFLTDAVDVASL